MSDIASLIDDCERWPVAWRFRRLRAALGINSTSKCHKGYDVECKHPYGCLVGVCVGEALAERSDATPDPVSRRRVPASEGNE